MGSKNSKPDSPNYGAAAEATAAANRTDINTPYGGLNYSQNPDGRWSANVSLSPEQQNLLNQQNRTSANLAGLQDTATSRVGQTMGQGFDTSSIASAPVNAGTTGQQAIEARMEPQFQRDENALRTRLANQGIMPGSEAYTSELDTFNRGRNDARSQASLTGIGLDTQARQQGFQEQSYLRGLPMNELNALRTGSQVSGPQFQGIPQTQGANYLAASQLQGNDNLAGYNAGQASQNNMTSGLFGLASQMPWGQWFSDRRLKRDVKLIRVRPDGLNVYSYTYVWGTPAVGMMADEVKTLYPSAVSEHPSGFEMVDYSKVG